MWQLDENHEKFQKKKIATKLYRPGIMDHINLLHNWEPTELLTLKIWRYLDLEKFRSLLEQQAIYFSSARQFDDAFEGSITKRHFAYRLKTSQGVFGVESDFQQKHTSDAFYELTRLTKVSCWHMNQHESAAMWKLYLKDGKGIAIQSTLRCAPGDTHLPKFFHLN
ncbi:MAG: hypothetical protein JKY60_03995 [Kordiimonadaceae bacterium]|nr:hypothetical protein [Kordiimonadaceae bacterium]